MTNIIYQVKNNINSKIYIGVHKTDNLNDNYMGSGLLIKKAIKKYGKENFTKSILFEYNNPDDAYLKESQIVNQDFVDRKNTYNLTTGGYGISLKSKFKESTKLAMRKNRRNQKGKLNNQFNGYYITPWGKFDNRNDIQCKFATNETISFWCKNSNKIIKRHSKFLKKSDIGKSYNEIGYDFQTI